MASPSSLKSRPKVTPPRANSQGDGFANPLAASRLTPMHGEASPRQHENVYRRPPAACLTSVLSNGQQAALPRGFFQSLGIFSLLRFSLPTAIPTEVCHGHERPAQGVHKRRRAARLARLLQTLPAHAAHARGRRLAGGSEGKTGKKDLPDVLKK